jgi:hypothetical protein
MTICACLEIHHPHVSITHQGRDNVGGVVIDDGPIDLTEYMELAADQICQSFVRLTGLNLEDTVPLFSREMLRAVLDEWRESDKHHDKDRTYNVDYINTITKARIGITTKSNSKSRNMPWLLDPSSR